jgi:SAM-dependent methyltransferase
MSLIKLFQLGMDRKINEPIGDLNPFENSVLNVGCGNKFISGAMNLDYPDWDADKDSIPLEDNSVDQIHAYHFLEHIKDPVKMLLEFQRVLKSGGFVNIVVPYYTSQMAAHDLDHKHVFCEETWRVLFGNPYYNKNKVVWNFEIRTNVIIGIVERNLALVTQLVKI